MKKRFLVATDLHYVEKDWHGMSAGKRMANFLAAVETERKAGGDFDAIFLLGDYSLDFWVWCEKGCYLNHGESRTRLFAREILPRLRAIAPTYAIAGNHEQYGDAFWQETVGNPRRLSVAVGGVLFVMDDTFGGNLDPKEHSDGTYIGADAEWIAGEMAKHPKLPAVLMAHHFDPERESDAFRRLAEDPQVRLLLSGHVHTADVSHPFGAPLVHAGQFSYSKEGDGLPHHGFVLLEYDDERDTFAATYAGEAMAI